MQPPAYPDWLDRQAYPFTPRFLPLGVGRMHYVDEGTGAPVVFLHGNPTWSFLYRHLIRGLSPAYRCVAPDLLGFGLSDKPPAWSYCPEAHARHVEALIEALALRDLTLVVQDWGGPIGLSYALRHPENVKRLVLLNTWMWPVNRVPHLVLFSLLVGGPVGRFLIRRYNLFAGPLLRLAFARPDRLTEAVHRHYRRPLDRPEARKGCWVLLKEILASGDWLARCWAARHWLAGKPALLAWGMKDPAFRAQELARWQALFPRAFVHRFEDAGHFVQEEAGPALVPVVTDFLEATR